MQALWVRLKATGMYSRPRNDPASSPDLSNRCNHVGRQIREARAEALHVHGEEPNPVPLTSLTR